MTRETDKLITDIYKHDISSPFQVLMISADRTDETDVLGVKELEEEQRADLEEFIGLLDAAVEKLSVSGNPRFAEPEIEAMAEYGGVFDGDIGRKVDDIADISAIIYPYVEAVDEGDEHAVALEHILEPIEREGVVEYNGMGDAQVYGDRGLCMVTNTLVLNTLDHGEDADIWAEVEEDVGSYRIHVWDDGPGLNGEYDREEIYEEGKGDNTGQGLYLARKISELFDGSLEYSEEYSEKEGGMGQTLTLQKADQYSTSESA